MTATSIAPLRKKIPDGELYSRLPEIEAKLATLCALTRDAIAVRCAVQERESEEYVPSECLVYLVRQHRTIPFDACSEALFKTLMERVLRGLPQAVSGDGENERLVDGNVRDEGKYRFLEMLGRDREQEYVEALDYFEVRFASALAALRVDAQRKVYRQEDRLEGIAIDHETGEVSEKVERAAGSFDPFDSSEICNFDYLLRLDDAIDALPDLQKAIVVLLRKGIPIESKEEGIVNISNILKKTPKTIRTHRDKAYATLRVKLMKGEPA